MQVEKLTKGKVTMGIMETIDMLVREETRHEEKTEFVTNLILNTDFDDAKIASLAVVGFDFVRKIRASLAKGGKN